MQIPTAPPPTQPQEPAQQPYISQSQSPLQTSSAPHHPTLPSSPLRRCCSAPALALRIMPFSVDVETGGRPKTTFRRRSQSFHDTREFPPAMPLLAWTGNGNVQMPWVLKRSYTDSGRLVIHEVKVRHHDFFRVSRNDGRLTLHLMHMDEPPTSAPQDPTKVEVFELSSEKKDKEEKRVRRNLLRPAPLPKREKHKLVALPQGVTKAQEEQETTKKKKEKESFGELKRMEQRLFRLPISSSSSELSSLAAAASSTATEKTDAVASLLRQGNYKRLSDVSRATSLPSITSSMQELLWGPTGGTGGAGVWLTDNRSDSNSPFQVPIPAIGRVRS